MPISKWGSSISQDQLTTILYYSYMWFAIEIVSNGYYYGVDTWLTISIKMSFLTCSLIFLVE
jgi:hypothetical protein